MSVWGFLVDMVSPRHILHNRAKFRELFSETGVLKSFLDNSCMSALETKMRDAEFLFYSGTRFWLNQLDILSLYLLYLHLLHLYSAETMLPFTIQDLVAGAILWMLNALSFYYYFRRRYVLPDLNYSRELCGVIHDLRGTAKDVFQVEEMSAHALLVSLHHTLNSAGLRNTAPLKSLHEMVTILLNFLGNASDYMPTLESNIREAAHKAEEALIEFQFPHKFRVSHSIIYYRHALLFMLLRFLHYMLFCACYVQDIIPFGFGVVRELCIAFASCIGTTMVVLKVLEAEYNSKAPENEELHRAINDFSMVMRDVIKIEEAGGNQTDFPPYVAGAASFTQDSGGSGQDVVVVGLDSHLKEIKDRLFQDSRELKLATIVGMGGIGKSTLAEQVYKDPDILDRFDIRAWVRVSQEYSVRHVLLSILNTTERLTDERREDSEEELALYLHKILMYRRYIIIMDDVWDTHIWEFLNRYLPDNNNGSRLLLTSRLQNVASQLDSSSKPYQMRCLSDDKSWELLCRKVFGAQGCPVELESVGREISQNCGGLPLAIVVIGGLLFKDSDIQVWRDVAEKMKKSELPYMKVHCLEILGLSYNHLPQHLRLCFLYMGASLQGNCEISKSRLINLWIAEGFVHECPNRVYTMEETAEKYLQALVDRNLILVCKRSCSGKIRRCSMHQLLRDVCVQIASTHNFLHVVESGGCVTNERPYFTPRRISIHPDALHVNSTGKLWNSYHSVLSVLCIASQPVKNPIVFFSRFMFLLVLDVLQVHFVEFPRDIIKCFRLKYLALHYDGSLPRSISELKYLQTIVHHFSFRNYCFLPMVIWDMPSLRHLYMKPGCYLSKSFRWPFPLSLPSLPFLQTLVGIRNLKWSKGIIGRIPNLKNLVISYDVSSSVYWPAYQLETLAYLHRLESLKIIIKYDDDDVETAISPDPPKLEFPANLKKLCLRGCGVSSECMTSIGKLSNLTALKLRCGAFSGPSWENVEGEFPELVFLLLEDLSLTTWLTDEAPFPRLECLVIRSCHKLKEIPSTIGEISTLEKIKLVDCPFALDSAKEIQKEQESAGNYSLKFHIEGKREAGEMNLEAGGVFPGRMQLISNVIQSTVCDNLLVGIFLATVFRMFDLGTTQTKHALQS